MSDPTISSNGIDSTLPQIGVQSQTNTFSNGNFPTQDGLYPNMATQEAHYPNIAEQQGHQPNMATKGGPYSNMNSAPGQQVAYRVQPKPQTVVHMNEGVEHIPNDHYQFSLFSIICCCFWFGLCAIRQSRNARDAIKEGRMEDARKYSKNAYQLNITSVVLGIFFTGIYGVILYFYFTGGR